MGEDDQGVLPRHLALELASCGPDRKLLENTYCSAFWGGRWKDRPLRFGEWMRGDLRQPCERATSPCEGCSSLAPASPPQGALHRLQSCPPPRDFRPPQLMPPWKLGRNIESERGQFLLSCWYYLTSPSLWALPWAVHALAISSRPRRSIGGRAVGESGSVESINHYRAT